MCLPGGSEPDVVGEDGGAVHVVVAVDGVDAVDDGDPGRVDGAPLCIPFTIFTHASGGAFFAGTLPPPLSTLPARPGRMHGFRISHVFTIHALN